VKDRAANEVDMRRHVGPAFLRGLPEMCHRHGITLARQHSNGHT
jgi:hypothetical protein